MKGPGGQWDGLHLKASRPQVGTVRIWMPLAARDLPVASVHSTTTAPRRGWTPRGQSGGRRRALGALGLCGRLEPGKHTKKNQKPKPNSPQKSNTTRWGKATPAFGIEAEAEATAKLAAQQRRPRRSQGSSRAAITAAAALRRRRLPASRTRLGRAPRPAVAASPGSSNTPRFVNRNVLAPLDPTRGWLTRRSQPTHAHRCQSNPESVDRRLEIRRPDATLSMQEAAASVSQVSEYVSSRHRARGLEIFPWIDGPCDRNEALCHGHQSIESRHRSGRGRIRLRPGIVWDLG